MDKNITMSIEMFGKILNNLDCETCSLFHPHCKLYRRGCIEEWSMRIKQDNLEKGIE